jgi:hypothetical protein
LRFRRLFSDCRAGKSLRLVLHSHPLRKLSYAGKFISSVCHTGATTLPINNYADVRMRTIRNRHAVKLLSRVTQRHSKDLLRFLSQEYPGSRQTPVNGSASIVAVDGRRSGCDCDHATDLTAMRSPSCTGRTSLTFSVTSA